MAKIKTVLITQRYNEMLDVMAQWLRDAGYRVRVCSGPNERYGDCWAHKYNDCPLWEQADLTIYDPWLATSYADDLFALERQRHPATPLLIWGPSAVPMDIADLIEAGGAELL